jgi:hypothetical protein
MWTGYIWLRVGISDGLANTVVNFGSGNGRERIV